MHVDPVSGGDPHDVRQVLGEVVGGREELVPDVMLHYYMKVSFVSHCMFTSPAQSRPTS